MKKALEIFMMGAALLFVSCISEKEGDPRLRAGDEVGFLGYVSDKGEVRTRTLETKDIAYDPFNMDFHIQLCCYDDKNDLTGPVHTEFGTYVVQNGFEGRLASKDGAVPLSWYDLNLYHTFYAWNIPWDSDYMPENEDLENGIEIKFENSSEDSGFNEHRNNAKYEHFIGARSAEPYSYKEHGKYVDLTFHHLVSRIRIGSCILIQPTGSIQEQIQADITFVGMPTEAVFYPHPSDNGRPRVEPKPADPDNGVTYFIHKEATAKDVFYICPEVDFSNVDFQIKVKDKEYEKLDTYYGTFDDVIFRREPGVDYDGEDGNDSRILHAGEQMTLNIVLVPGIGPGLSILISEWSTDDPTDSQYHTYPGIYSDAEVKEMHDYFAGQRTYGDEDKNVERLFEMYGQEKDIDGDGEPEKVFVLYDNVDISNGSNANIFPVPDGYIVDGMGHTITLKSNRGSNGDFGYTQTYFNVGPVRDVWLTDGTNTIYIDREGYVWIYDAGKQDYVRTDNKLGPLEGNEKSYDISCETGIVHKSTYYNNNIVGS